MQNGYGLIFEIFNNQCSVINIHLPPFQQLNFDYCFVEY